MVARKIKIGLIMVALTVVSSGVIGYTAGQTRPLYKGDKSNLSDSVLFAQSSEYESTVSPIIPPHLNGFSDAILDENTQRIGDARGPVDECEKYGKHMYTGEDTPGLLYGMCI